MHPKLLFDVIQRQAGTLTKAVLEGIMNGIDAAASRIDITVNETRVTVSDDGKGFRNRKEIESFFEMFGQPHDEAENKIFGTFRMGRGQLFSFGVNHWRTGKFEMHVDIKNKGLDYTLRENAKPTPGCRIDIELYRPLSLVDRRILDDGLHAAAKYSPVPVFVNGKPISSDPADKKWDYEDEFCYISLADSGGSVLFNLGIRTCEWGAYKFGISAIVVAKKQLKLNFARNDIMDDCPVWPNIVKQLKIMSDRDAVDKKKPMTDAQRERIAKELFSTDWSYEQGKLPIFTSVNGRHYNFFRVRDFVSRTRFVTLANRGDMRGDRLMQQKIAFVFSSQCVSLFGAESFEDFVELLNNHTQSSAAYRLVATNFEQLVKAMSTKFDIVAPKDMTDMEKIVVRTIETAQEQLIRGMEEPPETRAIMVGQADTAHAWTDGSTYVAFNRKFLKETGTDIAGWVEIGRVLLHELTHNDESSETHHHSPEFYENFHNSAGGLAQFVSKAIGTYARNVELAGRRLTKKDLERADRLNRAKKAEAIVASE
jgi:hypothetical protein